MKKLAIFDLDGTLLNTIADLAHSTNYALNKLGYPTHEIEKYNFMVGNGINKLFERALPEGEKTEENVLRVRKEFIPYYDIHNADDSRPYPGVPELLTDLQSAGIQIAVASNKYQAATEKLIAHYFPNIHFTAVFGQREGISVKPDPTVVFDILKSGQCRKRRGSLHRRLRSRYANGRQCRSNRLWGNMGLSSQKRIGRIQTGIYRRYYRKDFITFYPHTLINSCIDLFIDISAMRASLIVSMRAKVTLILTIRHSFFIESDMSP